MIIFLGTQRAVQQREKSSFQHEHVPADGIRKEKKEQQKKNGLIFPEVLCGNLFSLYLLHWNCEVKIEFSWAPGTI